ncbi:helix-turn-helix domain-containing protein [Deinococcus sp. UYEF24]
MNRIAVAFVGDRLKDIRESFGMNAITLSTLLNVHRNSVRDFESGATPDEAIIGKLVELFRVPRFYFFTPIKRQRHAPALFRASSKATKADKRRAEVVLEWAQEIDTELSKYVALPKLNLPRFEELPANPYEIKSRHLKRVALDLRSHWNLGDGPIPNVVAVLERNGFVIINVSLECDEVDALSYTNTQGRPYILINSDKSSGVRVRFTIVHEAIHQIIHANLPDDFDYSSAQAKKLLEKQVNTIVLEFLLGQAFLNEVSSVSLATLRALKGRWKVSMQAMLRYLHEMEVIDDSRYRSLHTYMSTLQWRINEPLDNEIPIERPALFQASFNALIHKMKVPRENLSAKLLLPEQIILRVANLPDDYFQPEGLRIKPIKGPENIKFGT